MIERGPEGPERKAFILFNLLSLFKIKRSLFIGRAKRGQNICSFAPLTRETIKRIKAFILWEAFILFNLLSLRSLRSLRGCFSLFKIKQRIKAKLARHLLSRSATFIHFNFAGLAKPNRQKKA